MYLELEKIKQSTQYLAEKVPDLFFTKFLKLMYYFDFISVLERGKPVTNDTYYHLPYGPVPTVIKDQLSLLREDNRKKEVELIDSDENNISSIFSEIIRLEPKGEGFILKADTRKIGLDYISEYEKELLGDIVTAFKSTSSKELVNKTHKEIPYMHTPANNIIDYKLAFYLKREEILPARNYSFNLEISQAEYFSL